MMSHKKKYLNHFEYGEQDFVPCEICKNTAHDIHHIKFKSHGGNNDIENLMALCRTCHDKAHSNKSLYEQSYFQTVHQKFMLNHGTNTNSIKPHKRVQ